MIKIKKKIITKILRNANLLVKVGNRFCSQCGLTQQQWVLLESLARSKDGLKLSDLGKNLLVTKSNITGIIDRLVKDGFVKRDQNPRDRRSLIAKITDKGKLALRNIRKYEETWLKDFFDKFKNAEVSELSRSMQKFYEHLYKNCIGNGAEKSGTRKSNRIV
jgi:MarR family 2-MHQ and catechol resistance regulon transcriptional repressor